MSRDEGAWPRSHSFVQASVSFTRKPVGHKPLLKARASREDGTKDRGGGGPSFTHSFHDNVFP
jgi:hypothetical protein